MSTTTTAPAVRCKVYKMLAKKEGIDAFTKKPIQKGEMIFYVPKGMYDRGFAVSPDSDFGLEIQTGPTWAIIDHTTTAVPAVTTAAPRPAPTMAAPAAIAAALKLAAVATAAPAPAAPAPAAPAPVKRNHGSGFRVNGVEDLIKILPLLQSGGVTLVAHPRKQS